MIRHDSLTAHAPTRLPSWKQEVKIYNHEEVSAVLVIATLLVLLLVTPYTRVNISSATRQGSTFISHTVPRSVTYVTVGKYMGQQGAGARDIASLQCFLMSLKKYLGLSFVLMEPYFQDNQLEGYVGTNSTAAIKFRDIFDNDYFNNISKETGRTEMVERDEFVQKRPSYTILIKFVEKPEMKEAVVWQSETVNGIPECLEREKLLKQDGLLTNHNSQNICVVLVVTLPINRADKHENPVMIEDIRDSIFKEWPPQKVTLMISRWGGYYYMPLESGLTCARELRSNITKLLFRPSKRLQHDAKRYEELFLDNQHKLAIMMRIEHVIKTYLRKKNRHSEQPTTLTGCFNAFQTHYKATYSSIHLSPWI